MWKIVKDSEQMSLAVDKVAVAKGVALYDGEEKIIEESGTAILTSTDLHHKTVKMHRKCCVDSIKQVAVRPASFTKSPKLVLVLESILIKCDVCLEDTVNGDRCEQCGSLLLWSCDVCDHDRNVRSAMKCMECGSAREDRVSYLTRTEIYMLSFRQDPPDSLHQALLSMIESQSINEKTADRVVGIGGILEKKQHLFYEREHAIASLNHSVNSESMTILFGLVDELESVLAYEHPHTSVDLLLPSGGLKWANPVDMAQVLEAFINEKLMKDKNGTIILADLYCIINRHCSVGYFVTLEELTKCLIILERKGKVKIIRTSDIIFVCSRHFQESIILDQVGYEGATVEQLSTSTDIPRPAIEVILDSACNNGLLVVDCAEKVSNRAFYQNIFLK